MERGSVRSCSRVVGDSCLLIDPRTDSGVYRNIFDLQQNSRACAYCSTVLSSHQSLPCNASTSAAFCPARFCNRLCLSRSSKTHPLLCQSQNPSSAALLKYARNNEWMALHALSQLTSRILLAGQAGGDTLEEDWDVVQAMAALGMEERFKDISSAQSLLHGAIRDADTFAGWEENQTEPCGRKLINFISRLSTSLRLLCIRRNWLRFFESH
jgi:hypothetical protein